MRSIITLVLFLTSSELGFAQQDSLADLFPLRVGNKWRYSFNVMHDFFGGKYVETDIGTAEYKIISSVITSDSTRWQFTRNRTFTRYYSGQTSMDPVSMNGSSSFELVEINKGYHDIYLPVFDISSVYPFWKYYDYSYLDSTQFFRYVSIDTTNDFIFSKYIGALLTTQRNLVFRRNIGVVHSTGWSSSVNSENWRWNYSLISPLFSNPHLTLPKFISFATLTGIASDTAIFLTSDGIDTVHIYSITSSDPTLEVSLSSLFIPPVSDAMLSIKQPSPKNGTSSARLIIVSSSISSPDTLDITIVGRMTSILKTNMQTIDFGQAFFSRRHLDTTITIINVGNLLLKGWGNTSQARRQNAVGNKTVRHAGLRPDQFPVQ